MAQCTKCSKSMSVSYRNSSYCSLQCFRGDLWNRLQENKALKQKTLEQQQLHAEFETSPERFKEELPPIIVKTEAEQKLDSAFAQLQAKLRTERQSQTDKLTAAFNEIAKKAQGL